MEAKALTPRDHFDRKACFEILTAGAPTGRTASCRIPRRAQLGTFA